MFQLNEAAVAVALAKIRPILGEDVCVEVDFHVIAVGDLLSAVGWPICFAGGEATIHDDPCPVSDSTPCVERTSPRMPHRPAHL